MSVIYWVDLLLMLVLGGWTTFGPNGNRLWGGFGLTVFLAFVMLGIRVFPIPLR